MPGIKASVGRSGDNRPSDVRLVQQLLNEFPIPRIRAPLVVDGAIGTKTIRRIEAFQASILKLRKPDGRVDPGGKTITALLAGRKRKKTQSLRISKKAKDLLKSIETLATKPYDDQTGDEIENWVRGATIGYGHLIPSSQWNTYKNGISKAQAETLLNKDLAPFENKVKTAIKAKLTQNEFDALVILAYNIGQTAFANSSVVKLINNPSATTPYPSLEKAWKAWNKSQGAVMRGLTNRRNAEWNIYTQAIYKRW